MASTPSHSHSHSQFHFLSQDLVNSSPAQTKTKTITPESNAMFETGRKYIAIDPIGRGPRGVVCSGFNTLNGDPVAIKKISHSHPVYAWRTLKELKLMRMIHHRNVIELVDVILPRQRSSFKHVYLVYELMDTDLERVLNSSNPLTSDQCKFLLFQLLKGLKYIHSNDLLHRDLKPENILVDFNFKLTISGFGMARTKQQRNELSLEYESKRWYRAPELLLGCDNHGPSIDIWSVGCILAELLGRSPIFPGTEYLNQVDLILDLLGSQQEEDLDFIKDPEVKEYIKSRPSSTPVEFSRCYPSADPLATDLLQKMLVFNPAKRISTEEALQHPYLAGLHHPYDFPTARVHIHLDEDDKVDEDELREMILKEILYYQTNSAAL